MDMVMDIDINNPMSTWGHGDMKMVTTMETYPWRHGHEDMDMGTWT